MSSAWQRWLRWRRSKSGHAVFMMFEFGLTYLFASLAIDTGSLLDYGLTLGLAYLTVQDGAQLFKKTDRSQSA